MDHRRRNHCEESLNENAERLALYKEKLILFRRKSGKNGASKGDATKEELNAGKVAQNNHREIIPLVRGAKGSKTETAKRGVLRAQGVKARAATAEEKDAKVFRVLRRAREVKRNFGKWEKRKAEKAEKEAAKKKK